MWTRKFWLDALERAIKTFAQSAVALIAVGAMVTEVEWGVVLAVSATASIVSILTSVASEPFGEKDTASVIDPFRPYV